VPNSGHSTPIFYKDHFNEVVADFLKNLIEKLKEWIEQLESCSAFIINAQMHNIGF
jgi:deoxyadenosine/deoxycytidine kinase